MRQTEYLSGTVIRGRAAAGVLEPATHPVDELPHHAGPAAVGFRGSVQAIIHQLDLKGELQDVSQLPQHVHAEALVLLGTLEVLVVGLPHHVGVFLAQGKRQHLGEKRQRFILG